MIENLKRAFHALPVALMAHSPTFLHCQAEDVEDQVHCHNDHQILFHLQEGGGKDEKGSPCINDRPLYWLPSEPMRDHLCDDQQREDSKEEKEDYCIMTILWTMPKVYQVVVNVLEP